MVAYKTLPHSKVSFELIITQADKDKAKQSALEYFRQQIKIKGFRPGHAPDQVIIAEVGEARLEIEMLDRAITKQYRECIKTHHLQPLGTPQVDFSKKLDQPPHHVTLTIEVFPQPKIDDFAKIKLPPLTINISDQEINEVMEQIMVDRHAGRAVDRAAKKGDLVQIDFAGLNQKNEIIPGTNADGYWLKLGSGTFLPDLEQGIIGLKANQTKSNIVVTFPKEYRSADLAGKKIPFQVKVHEVQTLDTKALKAEQLEKITGQKDLSDTLFREKIRTQIEQQKRQQAASQRRQQYEDQLVKRTKVELPESWIKTELEGRLRSLENHPHFAKNTEHLWSRLGVKNREAWEQKERPKVEQNLKAYLALSEIVKQKKIDLDKDEIAKIEKKVKAANPKENPHQLRESYIEGAKIDKYLRSVILVES